MIGYESIQLYAKLSGFPSGASLFTQYHIPFPPASRLPSRKETTRWRVLYRITRQLVSSRAVSTSTGISGCFQPGQANVVLGPTPLAENLPPPAFGLIYDGAIGQLG